MPPLAGRRPDWGGHVLLVHGNEQERRAGVVAWARQGLTVGAKIVYVETADEASDQSFTEVLSSDPDVANMVGQGQLQVVDPTAVGMHAGWLETVVDDGLAAGFPTVRLGGDVAKSLQASCRSDHFDAERAIDELCRTRPVSMLCQHSVDVEDVGLLEALWTVHGSGIRASNLLAVPTVDGIALSGEVDISNKSIIRSALAAVCDRTEKGDETVVDLTFLDFLDTAGARALLLGTVRHRDRGGRVRLCGLQPLICRLLLVLGVDRIDGIVLGDAP